MKRWYHKGDIRIKLDDGVKPPEGFIAGYGPRGAPWNKGLTAASDHRVKLNGEKTKKTRMQNNSYQAWNKGLTKETDSRVKGLKGCLNGAWGKTRVAWNKGLNKHSDNRILKISQTLNGREAWNKGLTKEVDERMKKISEIQRSPRVIEKRFNSMKANNHLNPYNSLFEKNIYFKLVAAYGVLDVIYQYYDKIRYPFKCDFYIKSEDLFIEVNGNWTHGSHPFNPNNGEDIKKKNEWIKKSKNSKYYKNAVYTWTDLDVRKINLAKNNKLNFIAIYKDIIIIIRGGVLQQVICKTPLIARTS